MKSLNVTQIEEVSGGIVEGGCVIGPRIPTTPKTILQEIYMKELNKVKLLDVKGGLSIVYNEGTWLQAIKKLMDME